MIEYKSAIVDECGDIVAWCQDLTNHEIEKILSKYPECYIHCIEIG